MKEERRLIRVLHTVGSLNRAAGGPSRTVPGLCAELGRLGARVQLLSTNLSQGPGDTLLRPPSDVVTTSLAKAWRVPILGSHVAPSFRQQLSSICGRFEPDIIHDHGVWLPSNHSTAMVARKNDKPLVVSTRGMLEPWSVGFHGRRKRIAWRLFQFADLTSARCLHATSQQEAENLRRFDLRQPIAIIPNGIDLPDLRVTNPEPSDSRVALFVSRIHPKKGLMDLVKAWAVLRPPGWRVVVAGPDEGGHRGEVEASVRAANLTNVFTFLGPVDGEAKWQWYRRADLFVLPSYSENFGVVIAEALAFGIPVITTKACPWGGLVDRQCGWWIEPGAPALTACLRDALAASQARMARMREAAARYGATFGWVHIAEQMMEAYLWVLGMEGRPPSCVVMD